LSSFDIAHNHSPGQRKAARAAEAVHRLPPAYVLLLPAALAILLFLLVPLAATALLSLTPNGLVRFQGLGIGNYIYFFSKQYYRDVVTRTLWISAMVTLISVVLAYPAAYALRGMPARYDGLLIVGLTFPILTGPLVVVLGWMVLLADGGPLFAPLIHIGLLPPLRLIGSSWAIVVGLVNFTLPFAILTIFSSVKQIPNDYLEASRSLGAGPVAMFLQVILPLSLPGIASATIVTFALSASAYASPYYLGGAGQQTLTTLIAQFVLTTFNTQMAATTAIILVAIMVVIVFGMTKLFARAIR
jgi:ABC-type spermidine/putrescine transport system permease subunit I